MRLIHNTGDELLILNSKLLINFQFSTEKLAKLGEFVAEVSQRLGGVTIILKGKVDVVCRGDEWVVVQGGNPGMTKGGTGDVLAGVVAALYTKNEAMVAAQAGSYVTKKAGESLFEEFGPYYNAGDLVKAVPKELGKWYLSSNKDDEAV
jgi:NAD(P)H-hydrate repair Nnr-like enzyme with NAD(P)H-hydrate dehydratase domain